MIVDNIVKIFGHLDSVRTEQHIFAQVSYVVYWPLIFLVCLARLKSNFDQIQVHISLSAIILIKILEIHI